MKSNKKTTRYNIITPQNGFPGQEMEVKIPKPKAEVIEKGLGKHVLNSAFDSMEQNNNQPPAINRKQKNLTVSTDHIVDENDELNKQHRIISVHEGEEVLLMGGNASYQ